MSARRWFWYWPGDVYAMGPVEAKSAKDARRQAREWAKLARLPRGFAVWPESKYERAHR